MPLPAVLDQCVESVGSALKTTDPLVWVNDEPTQDDLDHILNETSYSRFDPLELRKTMYEDLKTGKARLVCRRCRYAKVLVVGYKGTTLSWRLWARIFQAFGPPPAKTGEKEWRVVLFANPTPRLFPDSSKNLNTVVSEEGMPGPAHINGGYAYPKRPTSVIIYRLEEAERVLVHELLHAAGTDNLTLPEETREVLTETWAELFLIAIQAQGNKKKAQALWQEQAQWIADQNARLKTEFGVDTPSKYAWRYTVGRTEALASLGLDLPEGQSHRAFSLRFTAPSLTQ